MTDNVVGLHGFEPPNPEGAASVIEKLEAILAEARRGEIVAFACAAIRPNGEIGTMSSQTRGYRHQMLAGAAYLMNDLCNLKED